MSIWKMGLEAVSLENAMPCFCVLASLEWDVWYRQGLWRIVCAMQRPPLGTGIILAVLTAVVLLWRGKTHRMDGFGAGTGIGGAVSAGRWNRRVQLFMIDTRNIGEHCGRGI